MNRIVPLCAAVVLVTLISACSSFNSDWKRAESLGPPPDDISGAWDGSWRSDADGHHGRLRCVMRKESEQLYQAEFRARFWKVFFYTYGVPFQVGRTNDEFAFHGASDLGRLVGGVYSYEGTATPTNFLANYRSRYDNGVFVLKRPTPGNER